MAGAACARALADAGHRCARVRQGPLRRRAAGAAAGRAAACFDHGAQYLSAPAIRRSSAAVDAWQRAAASCTAWPGPRQPRAAPVLVGVPAMNAPVKALLAGLAGGHGSPGGDVSAMRSGGWSTRAARTVERAWAVRGRGAGGAGTAGGGSAGEHRSRCACGPRPAPGRGADGAVLVGCWPPSPAAGLPIDAAALRLSRPARLGGAQRRASPAGARARPGRCTPAGLVDGASGAAAE